jgi:hypothetical protein
MASARPGRELEHILRRPKRGRCRGRTGQRSPAVRGPYREPLGRRKSPFSRPFGAVSLPAIAPSVLPADVAPSRARLVWPRQQAAAVHFVPIRSPLPPRVPSRAEEVFVTLDLACPRAHMRSPLYLRALPLLRSRPVGVRRGSSRAATENESAKRPPTARAPTSAPRTHACAVVAAPAEQQGADSVLVFGSEPRIAEQVSREAVPFCVARNPAW